MINFDRTHSPDAPFDKSDFMRLMLALLACENEHGQMVTETDEVVFDTVEAAAIYIQQNSQLEHDNWDGCVWYELLEKSDSGSLAHRLATQILDGQGTAFEVAQQWLIDTGRHTDVVIDFEGSRYIYDGNDVCEWQTESGWNFLFGHSLETPTDAEVITLIKRDGGAQ